MVGLGASNTGKSTITKALLKTCNEYVGTFDGNNFAYRNTGNDSASQNRWLMLLKNKRIIFSNEIKSTIPLNGNLIKMVSSGGDAVVGREHAGNESEFYLSFLCVVFANDLPKIMPYDDAVNNRVRVISYTKPYVLEPTGKYELKMDENIDNELNIC
jgi:phage/plasmid-associated DNA primase